MAFWKPTVKSLIEKNDPAGLDHLLSSKPDMANEGITIPFDLFCQTTAHPLHRIADAVFSNRISDQDALELAKVLLKHGASIEGFQGSKQDAPILAAASLHAEQYGIFLLENGADSNVIGSDGASALHWAAYCGSDKLVVALIAAGAKINLTDSQHQSTPLQWAIHCITSNDTANKANQAECIKLLISAGADTEGLDQEAKAIISDGI